MVEAISISYTKSDTCIAQGSNVDKARNKGYYKHRGGNGSYRMVKPSIAILTFKVDGMVHTANVKELIREAYQIQRVSEKHANRFLADLQSGALTLSFDNEVLDLA